MGLTGDPVMCSRCGVILNAASRLEDIEQDSQLHSDPADIWKAPFIHPKIEEICSIPTERSEISKIWKCEFCDQINLVDLEQEEIPSSDTIDYVLEPPKQVDEDDDSSNIIFCIDISGSMCVTTEVNDRLQLKGVNKREQRNQAISAQIEDLGDQFLPGQRRGVTMVSRLQCVQSAVETKIQQIVRESPSKRVGLVSFNHEVSLMGDCSQDPLLVTGDRLHSWDELQTSAANFTIDKPISESKDAILEKLWDLEETGPTALGPALQLSIAVAGKKPGSRVILCTDGLANVGLGSLEEKQSICRPYYVELAEQAKLHGVTVSVISLIGSECCLEELSAVTEQSGGSVQRVDPLELAGQMGSLLEKPVLGYTTMAMIVLHRGLQFRGEMDDEEDNRNWVVRDLGNVRADTELTVSYGFRPKEYYDMSDVDQIPFQLQLMYSKPNGERCLRICTSVLSTTNDRLQAEQHADVKVIGTHAALRAAKYAKEGDYQAAQMEARAAQRFLRRNAPEQLERWSDQVEQFDVVVRSERHQQSNPHTQARSDSSVEAISKAKSLNVEDLF